MGAMGRDVGVGLPGLLMVRRGEAMDAGLLAWMGWLGRLTSGIFPRNGGEDVRCTGLVEAAPPMAG